MLFDCDLCYKVVGGCWGGLFSVWCVILMLLLLLFVCFFFFQEEDGIRDLIVTDVKLVKCVS